MAGKENPFMKIDFHVHTHYSPDSIIKPKDLAEKSRRLGIIPAITDHCSVKAHKEIGALGIPFIPGNEILTDRGDLIGLYFESEPKKRLPFEEALDIIRTQGGLSFLPHMFDTSRTGCGDPGPLSRKIDIIETFNARCMDQGFNEKAESFAEKNDIPGAAGSDSHFLFEFGSTYNIVPEFDIDDPKQFLEAIRRAEPVTKKAPFYVRGTTSIVKLLKKF